MIFHSFQHLSCKIEHFSNFFVLGSVQLAKKNWWWALSPPPPTGVHPWTLDAFGLRILAPLVSVWIVNFASKFLYLLYFSRNKPSKSVTVGSSRFIVLNDSARPKIVIQIYLHFFPIFLKNLELFECRRSVVVNIYDITIIINI